MTLLTQKRVTKLVIAVKTFIHEDRLKYVDMPTSTSKSDEIFIYLFIIKSYTEYNTN